MSNTSHDPGNPDEPEGSDPWLHPHKPPMPLYGLPANAPPLPAAPGETTPMTPEPVPLPAAAAAGPAASAPTGGLTAAKKDRDDASLASIVDTLEAIIIALIVALTFRAYVVEAFVIPTGSMAPTLLGAHFKVICPKCGYEFDREASLDTQFVTPPGGGGIALVNQGNHAELLSNTSVPVQAVTNDGPVLCPNCQYPILPSQFPQFIKNIPNVANYHTDTPLVWANNGDRILVLKYIYSIIEPRRWDVIVFKEPMEARENYIKRLVGLPGDTVEIIDGDVFIAPSGGKGVMEIARKPEHVQKSLWQLVYDNDYYPRDEGMPRPEIAGIPELPTVWQNPWEPGGATADAWSLKKNNSGKTNGPLIRYEGSGAGELRFAIRPPYTKNILGYDNDLMDQAISGYGNAPPLSIVGDLRLEATWRPGESSGASVSLTLGRSSNCFRATWNRDGIELAKLNAAGQFERVGAIVPHEAPAAGQAYAVALNNVDHAVQFSIDGQTVMENGTPWTAEQAIEEMRTRDPNEYPAVGLSVGGACMLSHLRLLRDLYYTQASGYPNTAVYHQDANGNYVRNPLKLREDEFFVLGDNSRRSADGRYWQSVYPALDDLGTRPGIVPRRYLLGKAFFVYWPAGFPVVMSDTTFNPPAIPNAGDMRFIH